MKSKSTLVGIVWCLFHFGFVPQASAALDNIHFTVSGVGVTGSGDLVVDHNFFDGGFHVSNGVPSEPLFESLSLSIQLGSRTVDYHLSDMDSIFLITDSPSHVASLGLTAERDTGKRLSFAGGITHILSIGSNFTTAEFFTFVVVVRSVTSVTAVPEPETYAMLLAGLGLLGWVGRRRKQPA